MTANAKRLDRITDRASLDRHLSTRPLDPALTLTPATMVSGVITISENLLAPTDAGCVARGLEQALAGFGEGELKALRSGLCLALAATDLMLLEG